MSDESKVVAYPDSNRIGKFSIPTKTQQEERPLMGAMMKLMTVLEVAPVEGGTEFIAASPLFQPLVDGEEIPRYRIEFAYKGSAFANPDHEQECTHSNDFRFKAIRQFVLRVPRLVVGHDSKRVIN